MSKPKTTGANDRLGLEAGNRCAALEGSLWAGCVNQVIERSFYANPE